jgi:hypothetical protein
MVRAPCFPPLPFVSFIDSSRALETWKHSVTGALRIQVHPCAIQELLVDPLPEGETRDDALYPEGASRLKGNARDAVLFSFLFPFAYRFASWYTPRLEIKDLVLFNSHGVPQTVVGAFKPDQVRAFHQYNLPRSDEPALEEPAMPSMSIGIAHDILRIVHCHWQKYHHAHLHNCS